MRRLLAPLICDFVGHRYRLAANLQPGVLAAFCTRCGRQFHPGCEAE